MLTLPPLNTNEPLIGVFENFLSPNNSQNILNYALERSKLFKKAQIGKGHQKKVADKIRNDFILWIDDWNISELKAVEKKMIQIKDLLRQKLIPVKRFESHFAIYKKGGFYLRHCDRHRNNPHRLITAVLYLTPWQIDMGGELKIYKPDRTHLLIPPLQGSLALFESELDHEVLITKQDRCSLTTWFRDDLIPFPLVF